jgi:hypothetical protein
MGEAILRRQKARNAMMDDLDRSWSWWHQALAGKRGPIHADEPKAGFYRSKNQDKTLSAVAIWYDSQTGELRYQDNGRDISDQIARERWPFVSRRPITEKTFWTFRDTGKWIDVDDAAQCEPDDIAGSDVLVLAKDISALKDSAAKYSKIESDEGMVLAQSLRAKLQEVGGNADKLRVAEKEPHLEASREVDAKWQPMIKMAKTSAGGILKAMEDWNNIKLAAAAKAQMSGQKTNLPPPSSQVRGGGVRAAHVGVKDVVTDIDLDKAFVQFRDDPTLIVLFFKLAQQAVDAGIAVPGATIEKRSAIR